MSVGLSCGLSASGWSTAAAISGRLAAACGRCSTGLKDVSGALRTQKPVCGETGFCVRAQSRMNSIAAATAVAASAASARWFGRAGNMRHILHFGGASAFCQSARQSVGACSGNLTGHGHHFLHIGGSAGRTGDFAEAVPYKFFKTVAAFGTFKFKKRHR